MMLHPYHLNQTTQNRKKQIRQNKKQNHKVKVEIYTSSIIQAEQLIFRNIYLYTYKYRHVTIIGKKEAWM